ncbi:MAG: SWIM zinc finger family protein [Pirellulaceae bacterium]
MIIFVDYASPSVFESNRESASLGLATNLRRPVRFHGVVRDNGFNLRIALRALGEAIWSNDSWIPGSEILDPVITVHPDRVFFEAFSQDQSVYAALIVDPAIFDIRGESVTGTTNIDFTAWLWGALGEMRSGRHTTIGIGPEGFEVATQNAGGRFERKVDLPDAWVRGFLQVQAAMAFPGTRIDVQPADLLSAIRFLRYTKAKVSPRALRYEFEPGEDARLVLEPWEHSVRLVGAEHGYTEKKVVRIWGRRRLKLIEGLLPFADSVQVYLKGRAMPSFYAVKLAGMTFVLGLSGFSDASFTSSGGFDLLSEAAQDDDPLLEPALELLRSHYHRSVDEVAQELRTDQAQATRLLTRLCRRGQCMFDVETRRYRHRELFETPIDEEKYFPPDLRRELASQLLRDGRVRVDSCCAELTVKTRKLKSPEGPVFRQITYRDWHVSGAVGQCAEVQTVINDTGSIIFGRCTCPFFDANLLQQGPCEHILALFQASADLRVEEPTSTAASPPVPTEETDDDQE